MVAFASVLYTFREQFLVPAIVMAALWYGAEYIETSVRKRWTVMKQDDREEERLIERLTAKWEKNSGTDDIQNHPLNNVNPNVFEYGKADCQQPETKTVDDSFDAKLQNSLEGTNDLGHFVHQVPDASGCGRSPFAFEIMEKSRLQANGSTVVEEEEQEYRKADVYDELGGSRRCSTRRCY